MKQFIINRAEPKCGLCRYDPNVNPCSLALLESVITIKARKCGFKIDEAIEFKKQVQEMRKK